MGAFDLRWLRHLASDAGPAFFEGGERIDRDVFVATVRHYRAQLRPVWTGPQRLVLPLPPSWRHVALAMALLEDRHTVLLYPPAEPLTEDVRGALRPRAMVYVTPDDRVQVFSLSAGAAPSLSATLLFLTGGTGGRPRLAAFAPDAFLGQYIGRRRPSLRSLPLMPIFHFGGFDLMMRTLGRGGAVKLVTPLTPSMAHEALTTAPVPSVVSATPSFWKLFLLAYGKERYRGVVRVNTGGEAPWPGLPEALRACFPEAAVHNTWASTETGLIRGDRVRVRDGVVWARPQPGFRGYWGRPLQLDAEGFFCTGDRGRLTPAGEVVFEGRTDDMVKVQGHPVSLRRVEDVILSHPAVAWVRVRAVHHPMMGVFLEAAVVPAGDDFSVADLRRFLKARLFSYEVPVRIRVEGSARFRPNWKR